jgi:hypothetical protein
MKTATEIKNCLVSDLTNMISELEGGNMTKETLIDGITEMLDDAGLDTDILIKVLEDKRFGELGKDKSMAVKISYGY